MIWLIVQNDVFYPQRTAFVGAEKCSLFNLGRSMLYQSEMPSLRTNIFLFKDPLSRKSSRLFIPFQHKSRPSSPYLEQCSLAVPLQSDRQNKGTVIWASYQGECFNAQKMKMLLKNLPTAAFVNPGRSMRVKLTTAKKEPVKKVNKLKPTQRCSWEPKSSHSTHFRLGC